MEFPIIMFVIVLAFCVPAALRRSARNRVQNRLTTGSVLLGTHVERIVQGEHTGQLPLGAAPRERAKLLSLR